MSLAARALAVWGLIMVLEVGNGLLRKVIIEFFVDDLTARQIGVALGSVMIVLVAYLTAGWLRVRGTRTPLLVGAGWVLLTVAFEILLGRMVLGLDWARIGADYDLRHGGLMPIGLLVMAAAPLLGARLRRQVRVRRHRRRRAA